jgi:hypothetical protein
MRTTTSRGTLAATAIALALLGAACGNTSDGVDDADVPTTRGTVPVSGTPGNPTVVLPTGADICGKLTSDVVGTALDLDITAAVPSDPLADVAPSCAYNYTGRKGAAGTVSVSVLRPLDMVGRTGAEGYKTFVNVNKQLAVGVDYDEVPLIIGRRAVRFTTDDRHLAVADSGNQVIRVEVPRADAAGDDVDALLATVVGIIG